MSNIDRVRRSGGGPPAPATSKGPSSPPAQRVAPLAAPDRVVIGDFPSPAGTAVLNLSVEQIAGIRDLLVAMLLGRALADDVRHKIFGMLSGGQRRMAGAAYFFLSVRV